MAQLSDLAGRFEALLGLLEQGRPLDADARKLLDEEAERAKRTRFPSFFEVDDVNDWWLYER